jgi:hypothetical protein
MVNAKYALNLRVKIPSCKGYTILFSVKFDFNSPEAEKIQFEKSYIIVVLNHFPSQKKLRTYHIL